MTRTILARGHGPGIVRTRSGASPCTRGASGVALVARNAERLAAAAASLGQAGVSAKAFPCDLAKPDAVRAAVRDVRAAFGPITAVHYNAYAGGAGDLTTAPVAELHTVFETSPSSASSPRCKRRCPTSRRRRAPSS